MMMLTLAQRELRSLFLSPLAWSILAIVQLILAYLFLTQLNEFLTLQPQLKMIEAAPGATDLVISPLYGSATFILMMVVPLLTMRIISEERRSRSLPLLFSAPLSMTEIVIGKYLGIVGFLLVMIVMISLMPLSLLLAGNIDLGLLASIVLGLLLLVAAFAAVGLYMSSLTQQPTVAAVSTFGVLLLLWIIDWAGGKAGGDGASELLGYLSMLRHYEGLARGLFSSADVIYFLLFIATFLILSIRRLDVDRMKG
ncbi:MAG: ABC transporter permease subunit [Thioalkalispiraceae bacterium]|jgi:ABC-2 type transport system permease protein